MKYEVVTTANFEKAAKPLLKKYPSLKNELIQLEADLQVNPQMGTSLGNNTYKIRVAIKSKGKKAVVQE
jgi:mRNA-degrading endonuclease RelE of RelBE toxin-antitoxin system